MNCQDARREILSAVRAADLPAETAGHISVCDSCALLLQQTEALDALFGSATELEPNPFLWTRIKSRLSDRVAPSGFSFPFRLPVPVWVGLAAMILCSAFLTVFQSQAFLTPDQVALQEGIRSQLSRSDGSNPFLGAQAALIDSDNPFLEAMLPSDGNPFRIRRAP